MWTSRSQFEEYPEYPGDCTELTKECRQDYLLPTPIANVPSRTTYSLKVTEKQAVNAAPKYVRKMTLAINEMKLELHEHTNTVDDLLVAQNRDVHVLQIKKIGGKGIHRK